MMSLKINNVLGGFGGESNESIQIRQPHLAKDLLKLEDLALIIPLAAIRVLQKVE